MLTLITNNLDLLLTLYLIGIPVFMALLVLITKLNYGLPDPSTIIAHSAIWPLSAVYLIIGFIFDVIFNFFRR